VNGIDIDLRGGDQGQQRLVLALERQVDRDLFEGLCRTLASSLEHASDSASSLAVSLTHVRRWKTFLAGRSQHLSSEEVRGLFAEITFLLELADRKMSSSAAVGAWLGPERSHQDFIFGNTAVEIKSLSGTERSTVRVSSEDQLESLNDALFLRIYRLSNLTEATGARSLNGIVTAAHARLDEGGCDRGVRPEAGRARLRACSLTTINRTLSSAMCAATASVTDFRVSCGRNCRQGLPALSYDIRLETIAPFECDGAAVFGEH
jgi:hypothetical protein